MPFSKTLQPPSDCTNVDGLYRPSSRTLSTMSDPISFQSSTSNSSHAQQNESIPASFEQTFVPAELEDFDIVDSLDFDDVDGTLIDQEMMHQQRDALIRQLYETERKYLDKLETITNLFIHPLRNNKQHTIKFLGAKKPLCTEKEMYWLFGNFEDMYQFHSDVVKSLEERLSIWGPTQIISDVIQTWFPRLQQHYHVYFGQYDVSITTYERMMRYQPFKKFVEAVDKKNDLQDKLLLSLLKAPKSCISRLAELLITLSDSTSSLHPDYVGLMQCKTRIKTIVEEFKYRMEDTKNVDKVYDILNSMSGQPFSVKAERRLYLENHFDKVVRLAGEDRSYFLFSDIIVFARKKGNGTLQYKGHIVLDKAKVRALTAEESGLEDWSIEITSSFQGVDSLNTTFMSGPTIHIFRTASPRDQVHWVTCIEKLIAQLENSRQSKLRKTTASESNRKPGVSSAHSQESTA
ncbi:FERM, RhoGEF and pleckstrin domain-containing protein 2 [Choanephora cucurbitarum]|uniref:FERM, RhoGEF and pleckstrin domain-containing protein 2 n=1 Tax=Choanephora cucurbitarum TaxID=101091 RepID=A0A1C7NCU8_9FUNG|nr:FERM, RhoGEF and pleckstrin domain-containing protein 2 [Choanephora cucurbitarum]